MKFSILIIFLMAIHCLVAEENKTIKLITANSTADGKTNIHTEKTEECISRLPNPADLIPEIHSETKYLKKIMGDSLRKEHVKLFTATVEIHYLIRKKELLIASTNSVEASQPQFKEIVKNLPEVKKINSDPADSDFFSASSPLTYYFNSKESAGKSALDRAKIWLKSQKGTLCPDK